MMMHKSGKTRNHFTSLQNWHVLCDDVFSVFAHAYKVMSYLYKLWNFCVNEETACAWSNIQKINTRENQQWKKAYKNRKKSTQTQSWVPMTFKHASVCLLVPFEFLQQAESGIERTTRKHTFSVDICAKWDTSQSTYIIVCSNSWLPFSFWVRVRGYAVFIRQKKYELNFNFNSFRLVWFGLVQFEQSFYFNFPKHMVQTCTLHDFTDFPHILWCVWLDGLW